MRVLIVSKHLRSFSKNLWWLISQEVIYNNRGCFIEKRSSLFQRGGLLSNLPVLIKVPIIQSETFNIFHFFTSFNSNWLDLIFWRQFRPNSQFSGLLTLEVDHASNLERHDLEFRDATIPDRHSLLPNKSCLGSEVESFPEIWASSEIEFKLQFHLLNEMKWNKMKQNETKWNEMICHFRNFWIVVGDEQLKWILISRNSQIRIVWLKIYFEIRWIQIHDWNNHLRTDHSFLFNVHLHEGSTHWMERGASRDDNLWAGGYPGPGQ
jgi:hypothetical protein